MYWLTHTHTYRHTHTHTQLLQGSHPGVRQTFPQGGITMISHRAGPLPLEGRMDTWAGNTYRLKRGRQRQKAIWREKQRNGLWESVSEVRLGQLEGGGGEERRKPERSICRRKRKTKQQKKKKNRKKLQYVFGVLLLAKLDIALHWMLSRECEGLWYFSHQYLDKDTSFPLWLAVCLFLWIPHCCIWLFLSR